MEFVKDTLTAKMKNLEDSGFQAFLISFVCGGVNTKNKIFKTNWIERPISFKITGA